MEKCTEIAGTKSTKNKEKIRTNFFFSYVMYTRKKLMKLNSISRNFLQLHFFLDFNLQNAADVSYATIEPVCVSPSRRVIHKYL